MVVPAKATQVTSSSNQSSTDSETLLVEMPYEPLPEENFEFDKESRTITAYTGTAVDVIIPRTIGGVRQMDNYLFNFCKNLETVWCKGQVDRIGIQTFGVTPMERLCVNAKDIDINAFSGNEAIGKKFLSSLIITDLSQVKRGTCSMPDDPMPDIAEILSAYGM